VFGVTLSIHAFHNATVAYEWWTPTDVPGLYLMLAVRTAVFVALIAGVLRISEGLRRVTIQPRHANSGA
jgi:hypothetical protein